MLERQRLELGEDLQRELPACDELWVAVAMASEHGFRVIQDHISPQAQQKWVVGVDLATSPSVLRRFIEGGKKPVEGKYLQEPGRTFHPKVYVVRKGANYVGFVGSGNCTVGGFARNVEIGIRTEDQALCKALVEQIETWYSAAYEVDDVFLKRYAKEFERKEQRKAEEEKGALDVYAEVHPYSPLLDTLDERNVFWLKPIGTTKNPVRVGQLFDDPIEELNFSNKQPSGVEIGDIVFAYAIGTDKIISVFEVDSAPEKATAAQMYAESWRVRYPWTIWGRNLTPRLGRNWNHFNLKKGKLRDEFLMKYPKGKINDVDKPGFGSLSYGGDKLRLSSDFGRFITSRVLETLRNT
jgi:HKD family nuclease